MGNPEVVIVGAGAAGIGAGLALGDPGVPFVILEASDRVGGRAWTDKDSLPYPWDRGCHWFHCADVNPLVDWADRLGADYARQVRVNHFMVRTSDGWADDAELAAARAALVAAFDAIYEAAERGEDVPVAEVIPDAGRWSGPVRQILRLMESEDPELVSAAGYGDYDDTEVNWPVVSGYGDLIGRMAAGLPVRTGCAVRHIEQRTDGVRLETSQGSIEARAAIVTVSTNVLIAGAIGFGAGPARELLDLVEHVPCGAYEKVAIALRRRIVADGRKLFCMVDPDDGRTPIDFQITPADRPGPMMIAHIGGTPARELARAGGTALADFALDRLAHAFGADIRKEVLGAAPTSWSDDPFVRGAYSYARPGSAATRREMIAADTGNVAFAGEAFSRRWQATAHGAYQSGRDVAQRVIRRLAPA